MSLSFFSFGGNRQRRSLARSADHGTPRRHVDLNGGPLNQASAFPCRAQNIMYIILIRVTSYHHLPSRYKASSTRSAFPSSPFCPPRDRAMAKTKDPSSENSPHGSEKVVKADLETTTLRKIESNDAHDGSLDPTYVAKAKLINDAFLEIGMGRYQVGLLLTSVSVRYLSVTPFFSGIFLSSPVLATYRTCIHPPSAARPTQFRFDSDNLWPVSFPSSLPALPIHQCFYTVDCQRSYLYTRSKRICLPRSFPQARAEHWFTYRCRCFWCWSRHLGTQVRFLQEYLYILRHFLSDTGCLSI